MSNPISPILSIVALLSTGCCPRAWDAQPMDTTPDSQCRVGASTHGYDLYIWDCVDDEHVVISFYSAEMTCSTPEKETTACGELTELETQYAEQLGDNCESPPSQLVWE